MDAFKAFASCKNLELAWKRIRTGQNIQYKRFFREIYDAFDISSRDNIHRLSLNIKNGTYKPRKIERIFLPKKSGLQRPITLLNIEDQIVLQGIANIYARKLFQRRVAVESKVVCSNRLNRDKKLKFFLKPWQKNYNLFQRRKRKIFNNGNHYVAEFDLASFYDTISHDQLIKVFAPRRGNPSFCNRVKSYIKEWTTHKISHGISQGLIASDFLAECFMLPMDEIMVKIKDFHYLRYVDDILIFGKDQLCVQKGVVKLEELCRSIGLIPNVGKYGVKKLRNIDEVLKLSVSLGYGSTKSSSLFNQANAERLFLNCLSKRHDFIEDMSCAKYVLFRSEPNDRILTHCLRLLPKYPELIDANRVFLEKFGKRRKIANKLEKLLNEDTPYKYIEGEYWNLLSNSASQSQIDKFSKFALKRLRNMSSNTFAIKLGLYKFLSVCQGKKINKVLYKYLLKEKSSLLQSMSLSQISYFFPKKYLYPILNKCLKRKEMEPGIITSYLMGYLGIKTKDLNIKTREISSAQAQNILKDLGIIQRRRGAKPKPVDEILRRNFKIGITIDWKKILKKDYKHANSLLIMAESSFESNPNAWMGNMDSFNDLVIHNIAKILHNKGSISNLPPYLDRKGHFTEYGNFLESGGYFEREVLNMTRNLRSFHERRNRLPTSHPKDKRTLVICNPLKHVERDKYIKKLNVGYKDMIDFIKNELGIC